jgi:hypothetical protein
MSSLGQLLRTGGIPLHFDWERCTTHDLIKLRKDWVHRFIHMIYININNDDDDDIDDDDDDE